MSVVEKRQFYVHQRTKTEEHKHHLDTWHHSYNQDDVLSQFFWVKFIKERVLQLTDNGGGTVKIDWRTAYRFAMLRDQTLILISLEAAVIKSVKDAHHLARIKEPRSFHSLSYSRVCWCFCFCSWLKSIHSRAKLDSMASDASKWFGLFNLSHRCL